MTEARENITELFAVMGAHVSSNEVFEKVPFILVSVSAMCRNSFLILRDKINCANLLSLNKAGKGNCIIDKTRRNWCAYCRLQRCFQSRMNVAGTLILN